MRPGLQLGVDWLEPARGMLPAEHAVTSGLLEIRVRDRPVTLVETPSGARTKIYVPLYPLAEWISFNWWFLHGTTCLGLRPLPALAMGGTRPVDHAFELARINVRGVGDGYLWPDLAIIGEGAATRVAWWEGSHGDLSYLSSGEVWLPQDDVRASLAAFVEVVLERLQLAGVTGTRLEDEWSALRELDDDQAEFCRFMGDLGLDPFADDPPGFLEVVSTLPVEVRVDLAAALVPAHGTEQVQWVAEAAIELSARTPSEHPGGDLWKILEEVRSSTAPVRTSSAPPWEIGWEAARRVRDLVNLPEEQPLAAEELVQVTTRPMPKEAVGRIDGVVGVRDGQAAVLTPLDVGFRAGRFLSARALWKARTASPGLISRSADYAARVERAFAAELLAPAAGLAARINEREEGSIAEAAAHYGVNEQLVVHQVDNQLVSAR